MRKLLIIPAIFILTFLLLSQQIYGAKPNRVKYNIGGKMYNYHSLKNSNFTYVKVNGPGKLTVIFRTRFTSDRPETLSYKIIYLVDSTKIKSFEMNNVTPAADNSYIQYSNDKPSRAKTLVIHVKPDVQQIGFKTKNASPQVDFIYKFEPGTVLPWRDLKSKNDMAQIRLQSVTKSSIQPYYLISYNKFQKFRVKGPATLRVFSRLEYDYTMQGLLSYRIGVNRNDSVSKTYKLMTEPSRDMQYVLKKNDVPGKLQKFYIEVPEGIHTYEFKLLDRHFSGLIRVSKQEKKK